MYQFDNAKPKDLSSQVNCEDQSMRQTILLFFTACVVTSGLLAQQANTLPLSEVFEAAVAKQTRTLKGEPGPNYFQNHASYRLKARLMPDQRQVEGQAQITYYNESPDQLDQLVLRLYQNMYREEAVHDFALDEDEFTEGMVLSNLLINQTRIPLLGSPTEEAPGNQTYAYVKGTNLFIKLAQPLAAGASIDLSMDWNFVISNGTTIRMGTYGEDAFFVAYWYPQVAVYDDIFGWDTLSYNGMVEFYNDFNDYEVEITAPDDFLVWATGLLQNPKAVLSPTILARYEMAQKVDTVIRIVGREEYESGTILTQKNGTNTWKFKAEGVPDVAFAASDYYYWDATSVALNNGYERVLVDACYKPEAKDFPFVAGFSRDILLDLSTEVPGIPYPYPQMTAFNGENRGFGGGMEFPMMINDGTCFSLGQTFDLTYHEIAHTYFPFYMGINERRYAWMDEGWASYLPSDLVKEKGYSGVPMRQNVSLYEVIAGTRRQSSLMTESYTQSQGSYYPAAYYHPATAYHLLRIELGDELFLKALQTYIQRWKGKHPQPYDFFFTFNDVVGEDMSWFWEPWFFGTGKPDMALDVKQVKGKKANLVIKQKGDLPVPIQLHVELKSGEEKLITYPAAIWKDGKKQVAIQEKFPGKIVAIRLGGGDIPDKTSRNNQYEVGNK